MSRKDQGVDGDKCGACDSVVANNDRALKCDFCGLWFHITCQSINKKTYDCLKTGISSIHWYCRSCNVTIGGVMDSLVNIKRTQDKMQKEISELSLKIVEMESAKITSGDLKDVEKIIDSKLEDEREKNRRRNNLMFYGLEESKSDVADERKIHDHRKIVDIIGDEQDFENNVKTIFRVGARSDKVRPIKIIFKEEGFKRKVFDIAKGKGIAVSNDRTQSEREKYKKLKEEMSERTKRGEKDLIIRSGKILKKSFRD